MLRLYRVHLLGGGYELAFSTSQQWQQNHADTSSDQGDLSHPDPAILGEIVQQDKLTVFEQSRPVCAGEILPIAGRRIQVANRIPHESACLPVQGFRSLLLNSVSHQLYRPCAASPPFKAGNHFPATDNIDRDASSILEIPASFDSFFF